MVGLYSSKKDVKLTNSTSSLISRGDDDKAESFTFIPGHCDVIGHGGPSASCCVVLNTVPEDLIICVGNLKYLQ